MRGPCDWTVPDCTCANDCLEKANPTTYQAGIDWAQTILWASTGRRFGLCDLTVRPCGLDCKNLSWGWGMWWNGAGWFPYIGSDGQWRNCGCNGWCRCRPACEVYLIPPIHSITEVIVDGQVVDPGTYEVQDGAWLVRTEGCWPMCPDLADPNAFSVTYQQGEPVPDVLKVATRTLACEFIKGCTGGECRLPGRMSNLFRQGAQVQFVDIDRLTDKGWTGVKEVDDIIRALNPNALPNRPRVLSPDLPRPRVVTYPAGS